MLGGSGEQWDTKQVSFKFWVHEDPLSTKATSWLLVQDGLKYWYNSYSTF